MAHMCVICGHDTETLDEMAEHHSDEHPDEVWDPVVYLA